MTCNDAVIPSRFKVTPVGDASELKVGDILLINCSGSAGTVASATKLDIVWEYKDKDGTSWSTVSKPKVSQTQQALPDDCDRMVTWRVVRRILKTEDNGRTFRCYLVKDENPLNHDIPEDDEFTVHIDSPFNPVSRAVLTIQPGKVTVDSLSSPTVNITCKGEHSQNQLATLILAQRAEGLNSSQQPTELASTDLPKTVATHVKGKKVAVTGGISPRIISYNVLEWHWEMSPTSPTSLGGAHWNPVVITGGVGITDHTITPTHGCFVASSTTLHFRTMTSKQWDKFYRCYVTEDDHNFQNYSSVLKITKPQFDDRVKLLSNSALMMFGAIVGGILFFPLLICLLGILLKRKRRKKEKSFYTQSLAEHQSATSVVSVMKPTVSSVLDTGPTTSMSGMELSSTGSTIPVFYETTTSYNDDASSVYSDAPSMTSSVGMTSSTPVLQLRELRVPVTSFRQMIPLHIVRIQTAGTTSYSDQLQTDDTTSYIEKTDS
ncbi:hypothetical protein ACOMHN_037080 [Nucella lapillus]